VLRALDRRALSMGGIGAAKSMAKPISIILLVSVLATVVVSASAAGCTGAGGERMYESSEWRGFHMRFGSHDDVPNLKRVIIEYLIPMGVNVLILEVNTNFQFKSHPELSEGAHTLTHEDAHELAALCRANGIRLIPLFECLGHQGWGGAPNSILRGYPEWDETPHVPVEAEWPTIYCRSWCPLHPEVNPVIFDLMDELIEAFEADAFHVGMDEVFELADDGCPRCAGKKKSDLFAKAVNDYHDHLVTEKGVEMLMWGDRLVDAVGLGYSRWDADVLGIYPAIDMIPKDIIICDWHYDKKAAYPSVYWFFRKGFRVWPATWNDPDAAMAFMEFAYDAREKLDMKDGMLGMLVTGWNATGENLLTALSGGDLGKDEGNIWGIATTLRTVMDEYKRKSAD